MKIKCDYCKQMIDEGLEKCPHCGATINAVNRVASEQPKTIEELQEWYKAHNLPPEETTRFFIGKDIKEPKAFGIYQAEDGDFVVYKNKADGERAVRYKGVDQGYAVNELYQRLKAEIADQKSHGNSGNSVKNNIRDAKRLANHVGSGNSNNSGGGCLTSLLGSPLVIISVVFIIICVLVAIFDHSPSQGYYRYNNRDYYYQDSDWYEYDDDTDSWLRADNESELKDLITDDTQSEYSYSGHTGSSFESSSWYDDDDDDDSWYDSGSSDDSWDWDSDW